MSPARTEFEVCARRIGHDLSTTEDEDYVSEQTLLRWTWFRLGWDSAEIERSKAALAAAQVQKS